MKVDLTRLLDLTLLHLGPEATLEMKALPHHMPHLPPEQFRIGFRVFVRNRDKYWTNHIVVERRLLEDSPVAGDEISERLTYASESTRREIYNEGGWL